MSPGRVLVRRAPEPALAAYVRLGDQALGLAAPLTQAVAEYSAPWTAAAVLSREQAIAWGVSGIVARASGLDLDLRRDDPVLAYGDLAGLIEASEFEKGSHQETASAMENNSATAR